MYMYFYRNFTSAICIRKYVCSQYIPVINADTGLLVDPTPSLLVVATVTTTLPVNTPSASDGAINVSVVIELSTVIIVPL